MRRAFFISIFPLLLILFAPRANASEGTITLTNRVGEQARCYGFSVLMPDFEYRILVSCRDIIYPGGVDVYNYVVWAQPIDGGTPFRLGELGYGKVQFRTENAFSGMFVSKEKTGNPRTATSPYVMQGSVQKVDHLDSSASPIEESELGEPELTPSPTPRASRSPINLLRAGGVIAFVAIAGVILIIFLITRR